MRITADRIHIERLFLSVPLAPLPKVPVVCIAPDTQTNPFQAGLNATQALQESLKLAPEAVSAGLPVIGGLMGRVSQGSLCHRWQRIKSIAGKPVASYYGLLWLIYGLLWGIVACSFGLLGFPGRVCSRLGRTFRDIGL